MRKIFCILSYCIICSISFAQDYIFSSGYIAENSQLNSSLIQELRENNFKDNRSFAVNENTKSIDDVFIISSNKSDGINRNVYISTLTDRKLIKALILKNIEISTDKIEKMETISSPTVYDNINKNSEEFSLYQDAIETNKQNVGQTYEIKIKKLDKDFVELSLSLKEKSYYFKVDENIFSKDKVSIYYTDNIIFSFTYRIKLNTDYLISLEEIVDVYDKVPFWGDIPFLGKLFQAKGQSRAIKDILLFNVSTK